MSYHRQWLKRKLPIMAYLLLAVVVAFTFTTQQQNARDVATSLAAQTRTVLIASCERQNVLRSTLQGLVLSGIPQTRKYVQDGTLTPLQADRAIIQARIAARKLAPTDCLKVYPVLPTNK